MFAVRADDEALPNTVWPDTVNADDEALPRVEVPEVSVVIVALVAVRFVKNAVMPFRRVAKKLVDVALVVDALVAAKLPVVVLFVVVRLLIVPVVE